MPNEKARKFISDALASRAVYDQMAEREAAVWSRYFAEPAIESVRLAEQKAGECLSPGAGLLRLPQVLRDRGLTPKLGLSLGCGSGRAERAFLKQGVCASFHGIDIADAAIAEARRFAEEEELACSYETADLNFVDLPEAQYDFVVAQTSLHHVLHLEHLLDSVSRSLKPDGVFWVHDYIGESQFQFTDERLEIVNSLLGMLPRRLQLNHFSRHHIEKVFRKEPGQLGSPFESIRSGEIKKLLLERFDVIVSHEETGFLHSVAGLGMKQNFVENEDTRAIFAILLYFDRLVVRHEILPPVVGQFLLSPDPHTRFSLPKCRTLGPAGRGMRRLRAAHRAPWFQVRAQPYDGPG
jgi:SAM-dependent methyltransferase